MTAEELMDWYTGAKAAFGWDKEERQRYDPLIQAILGCDASAADSIETQLAVVYQARELGDPDGVHMDVLRERLERLHVRD